MIQIRKKKQNEEEVNADLLNLISPAGLAFDRMNITFGDIKARAMVVTKYNTVPDYGWINKLTNLKGVISKVQFKPTDDDEIIKHSNDEFKAIDRDLQDELDESVRQNKEKAKDQIKEYIRRLEDKETVGYCSIIMLIMGTTDKELADRVSTVKNTAARYGAFVKPLTLRQEAGYRSVSPYGMLDEEVEKIAERNMPISTYIGGFPNAESGLNDETGIALGTAEDDSLVILDMWKRGDDRVNSNWVITGLPGVGKSTIVKFITAIEWALGSKVIYLDPEAEQKEFVTSNGGDVIDCSGSGSGRMNPLQVRLVPTDEKNDKDKAYFSDGPHGASPLSLHFQFLRTFFKMYRSALNDFHIAKLEHVLENTYQQFKITYDTTEEELLKRANKDWPILSDLYANIEEELKANSNDKYMEELHLLLYSLCKGADAHIWNGHTTLTLQSDLVDLDVSGLQEADDGVKRAQYYNILSWCWHQIAANKLERVIFAIEEGYLFMDKDNPHPMLVLRNISKRIRKYEGSLMFITHAPNDLLDKDVRRFGQAILDNACFKFFMGCDGKNLKDFKDLFGLTQEEEQLLLSKKRGQGLLYAGNKRLRLNVKVPKQILEMMGTGGGR